MDDGLKQRLIGAIVLVALAIIFLPSLFNTDSRQRVDLNSQIPPEPLDTPAPLNVEEPVRPEGIPQASPLNEYYPHEAEEGVSEEASEMSAEATVEEDADSGEDHVQTDDIEPDNIRAEGQVAAAWSVQVGSFQSQDRAEALEKQLLDDNYKAYMRRSTLDGAVHYRVFVGPKLRREDAVAEQAELEKTLNIKALLVKFEP